MKAPSKDFFADEFVGKQWYILKRKGVETTLSAIPKVTVTEGECSVNNELEALHAQLVEKQKENDNLLYAMKLQYDSPNGNEVDPVHKSKTDDLIEELVRTKQNNARLRLDLEILAEKVNVEANKCKDKEKPIAMVVDDCSEEQFPPLPGTKIVEQYEISARKDWADVVAPNRERAAGVALQFIQPDLDGDKELVCLTEDDVSDEILR